MTPLEQLIATAKQQVAVQTQLKSATTKAKSAPTASGRVAAQAEILRLQIAMDWRPRAVVLLYDQWTCACGNSGEAPLGLFVFYEHATLANSTRLVALREGDISYAQLPKRSRSVKRIAPRCRLCAADTGFFPPL